MYSTAVLTTRLSLQSYVGLTRTTVRVSDCSVTCVRARHIVRRAGQQPTHLTGTSTLAKSQKPCMNLLNSGLVTLPPCSSSESPDLSCPSSPSVPLLLLSTSMASDEPLAISVCSIGSAVMTTAVGICRKFAQGKSSVQ